MGLFRKHFTFDFGTACSVHDDITGSFTNDPRTIELSCEELAGVINPALESLEVALHKFIEDMSAIFPLM